MRIDGKRGAWLATCAITAVSLLAVAPAQGAADLDSAKLTVDPSGTKAKISAVEGRGGSIEIVLAVKKGSGYKELDRDKAKGVNVDDGNVAIGADQEGDAYEKNGGQGLLSVGDFDGYFGWNIRREQIGFY